MNARKPSTSPSPLLPLGSALALCLMSAACTMNPMTVETERLQRAQQAYSPVEERLSRGPASEGYFTYKWTFTEARGIAFDPSQIEVRDGALKLRYGAERAPASLRARDVAIVEMLHGKTFVALRSFAVKMGSDHQSTAQFQLSNDGSRWYFHNGKQWKAAARTIAESNTAAQVNQAIRAFHQEVGAGKIFLKVFIQAPTGNEKASIEEISVEGLSPVHG